MRGVLPWVVGSVIVAGALSGHASSRHLETERDTSVEPARLANLPLALHRRAARYFESMRRTSDSPWFDAHLADRATALGRPGVSGSAYYEVPVEGPNGEPRGYLILTAGSHDFPVAGAMKGGAAASSTLASMARAKGEQIARIWMPSLFTFVAENARGEVVAQIGALPAKTIGLDRSALDLPPEARAGRTVELPGELPRIELPEALRDVRYSSWSSWKEYRDAHDTTEALDIEVMRRSSEASWNEEARLAMYAEALDPLASHRVALLARGEARFTVTGPGAGHVVAERVEGSAGDAWVRLRVSSEPEHDTAELALDLAYASGERELLAFAVAPRVHGAPAGATPPPITTRPIAPLVLAPVFPACRRAALRTRTGHYLRAVSGGRHELDARSDTVGPWETFEMERQSDGKVALRAGPSGFYVTASSGGGGAVSVKGEKAEAWQVFRPVPSDGGTFALQVEKRQYLSPAGGGGGDVDAKAASIGPDERFTVLCDPPAPRSTFPWARDEADAWTKQRKYKQLDGGAAPNRSPCASGCGATAWAMLIGYADYAAANGHPRFGAFDRLYLENGSRGRIARDVVAPELQDRGVDNITLELRDTMNDWGMSGCAPSGGRFTSPVLMAQANQYFWGRVPARVIADFDAGGIGTAAGAANVVSSIRAGHITAIGTGHLAHYPVAFGMHEFTPRIWNPGERRWVERGSPSTVFEVNWGWGEAVSASVPLHSWFKGIIDVSSYARVDAITRDCALRAQSGAIAPNARMDRDYNCRTHLASNERHVAFEVAERLLERDVMPGARARRLKVCVLKSTDIQCAPCNTTDRLIVRIATVEASRSCPADTVNTLQ